MANADTPIRRHADTFPSPAEVGFLDEAVEL
jgi:hypothetical protein